jgi:hypothetical protein
MIMRRGHGSYRDDVGRRTKTNRIWAFGGLVWAAPKVKGKRDKQMMAKKENSKKQKQVALSRKTKKIERRRLKRKGREGRLCKQFSRNLNFVPKLFYKYIGLLVLIPIRKGEEGLLQNHTSEIKIEFTKK